MAARFVRASFLAALLGLPGACASVPTEVAYPNAYRSPNPAPIPGYRVHCKTWPGFFYLIDSEFFSACDATIEPREAIRARG